MVDVGFWGGAVPGNIDQMAPLWDKGVFGLRLHKKCPNFMAEKTNGAEYL